MKTAPEDYTKDELWISLLHYIDHVGRCEGVSFLSPRYEPYFSQRVWEILSKADVESQL